MAGAACDMQNYFTHSLGLASFVGILVLESPRRRMTFSTAFHRRKSQSCDKQPLPWISEGASSLYICMHSFGRIPNAPAIFLRALCGWRSHDGLASKSLFRNILAVSPYGSRFCGQATQYPRANLNEIKILKKARRKNVTPSRRLYLARRSNTRRFEPYDSKNRLLPRFNCSHEPVE
jgi:hypothetical protein